MINVCVLSDWMVIIGMNGWIGCEYDTNIVLPLFLQITFAICQLQLQFSQAPKPDASQHDTLTTQQSHSHPIRPHSSQYQHQIFLLSHPNPSTHTHLSSEILGICMETELWWYQHWIYTHLTERDALIWTYDSYAMRRARYNDMNMGFIRISESDVYWFEHMIYT